MGLKSSIKYQEEYLVKWREHGYPDEEQEERRRVLEEKRKAKEDRRKSKKSLFDIGKELGIHVPEKVHADDLLKGKSFKERYQEAYKQPRKRVPVPPPEGSFSAILCTRHKSPQLLTPVCLVGILSSVVGRVDGRSAFFERSVFLSPGHSGSLWTSSWFEIAHSGGTAIAHPIVKRTFFFVPAPKQITSTTRQTRRLC